jgi:hypothetical protein
MTRPRLTFLSSGNSDLRRVYEEFGGPASIWKRVDRTTLENACNEYPLPRLLPVIERWSSSDEKQHRHWPWIALAASQYDHDRKRRSKLPDGPKPKEVENLLHKVDRDAESLAENLVTLQQWSVAPDSPSAPLRTAHLTWLHEFLVQNAAIGPRPEVDQSPDALLRSLILGEDFIKRLIALSVAARTAAARLDKDLIARTRSASDDSLPKLVGRCAKIWTSLRGRPASVNKVHRKSGEDRPDFVLFVCDIARLATGTEPTFDQVATAAFRTCHPGKERPE